MWFFKYGLMKCVGIWKVYRTQRLNISCFRRNSNPCKGATELGFQHRLVQMLKSNLPHYNTLFYKTDHTINTL